MVKENTGKHSGISKKEIDFRDYCRDIPDHPKQGIIFRDITNLLKNGPVFCQAIDKMASFYENAKIDVVVCTEARGFLIGSALAYRLKAGLVPIRKKGKLPWKVYKAAYELEYGHDHVEVHQDAIISGQNVLLVDDVIATGGTIEAVVKLVREMQGNIVGAAFLIELPGLKGREKIKGIPITSLIEY